MKTCSVPDCPDPVRYDTVWSCGCVVTKCADHTAETREIDREPIPWSCQGCSAFPITLVKISTHRNSLDSAALNADR